MGFFSNLFKKKYESVSVEAARELQRSGAVLIDVRETSEFRSGHAVGARSLPLSNLSSRYERELAKERDILVICQSGARSAQACNYLSGMGYKVTNVSGGTAAWRRAGLPIS
jgi:rhodanese-related sulfurtransferase